MTDKRFDVLVVGSGPAGSIAALVLARAARGSRSSTRPRSRGQGVRRPHRPSRRATPARVAARRSRRDPSQRHGRRRTDRQSRATARAARAHLSRLRDRRAAIAVRRDAASAPPIAAGAEFFDGRADEPIGDERSTRAGSRLVVDDAGASRRDRRRRRRDEPRRRGRGSRGPGRVLWGFAVRTYLDEPVELPHIMFWTPVPGTAFPGLRLGVSRGRRRANVGLGVGVLADRTAGRRAARDLDAFLEHAARVGVLGDARRADRGSGRSAPGSRWDSWARRLRGSRPSWSVTPPAW